MKINTHLLLALIVLISSAGFSSTVVSDINSNKSKRHLTDSRNLVDKTLKRSQTRGGIVYKHYCSACHGQTGTGNPRRAKLYGKDQLVIKPNTAEWYEKITRYGGEAVQRSPLMPVWQDELSEEQIADVTKYLTVLSDPVRRGKTVFQTNCILCHGVKADGRGRASVLYNPRPSDLTRSDKNEDYKRLIVTNGGAAMGRSEIMPVWGEQLTSQEIEDVVKFLGTIVVKNE
ncbi:MAG: c-type cytochrome [Gammaproteobacteria bacterium]|nr:c-type cytochrome [Gammaproteobacteria bacterium]